MDSEGDGSVDKKRESDVKWTALTMYMSQYALFRDTDTLAEVTYLDPLLNHSLYR